MGDVDPETLLEWLSMGQGDERDVRIIFFKLFNSGNKEIITKNIFDFILDATHRLRTTMHVVVNE